MVQNLLVDIHMKDSFYSTIVDHQATAILLVNEIGKVEYMNSAAEAIFNTSNRQAMGIPLHEFLVTEDDLIDRVQETLRHGQSWSEHERTIRISVDNQITVDCFINPVDIDGSNKALLEINTLDRQLKILKDNHLLKEHKATRSMLRGMAHEIKNPLGGLRGAAQLLQHELDDEELIEYTQIIIKEADRLHKLVDRMLGPNMVPNKVPQNIHEVMQHVYSLVSVEANSDTSFRIDYDPSIPKICFDRDMVVQAVLNITRNAIRAIDGSGEIIFKTRVLRRHTIGDKFHKLVACLSIIDNGPGVPEELTAEIFFPMVSGQTDGSGLGLAISQMLINQHGGLIEFDSVPGRTEFRILLPIEDVPIKDVKEQSNKTQVNEMH